jgi:hypothetical protein
MPSGLDTAGGTPSHVPRPHSFFSLDAHVAAIDVMTAAWMNVQATTAAWGYTTDDLDDAAADVSVILVQMTDWVSDSISYDD